MEEDIAFRFEAINKEISDIKLELKDLHYKKADTESYNTLRLSISSLESTLNEVMRNRKEDNETIKQIMSELSEIKTVFSGITVDNKYTLEKINDMEDKLDLIIKATTFNFFEVFTNFVNDNIIKKIIVYGSLVLLFSSIVSLFVLVTTGENIFPTIFKYLGGISGIGGQ